MIFCVFSFNRAIYLENCVSSIETCAPDCPVIIFDDNSDDPDTAAILERYRKKHRVIQPDHDTNGRHHLGGLYGNMQRAFEECKQAELVCFLQDDTQIVRPIGDKDIDDIESIFEQAPDLAFLNPCFIRGINLTKGAKYRYDARLEVYLREQSKRSSGTYFSALLIMKPARLHSANWTFSESEPANNQAAAQKFMPMGYLFAPFAMWLPEVPAYRGKRKTLGLKLAEKKRNCGFYPFKIITSAEMNALKKRNPDILPIAEQFLQCTGEEPPKPWAYNPLTNTGWLKKLNQFEVTIRRMMK